MHSDPTKDEMLEHLETWPYISEASDFDIEEAIYWFAYGYHSGQDSNLYSVLSTSEYTPSPIQDTISKKGISYSLYLELVDTFGKVK